MNKRIAMKVRRNPYRYALHQRIAAFRRLFPSMYRYEVQRSVWYQNARRDAAYRGIPIDLFTMRVESPSAFAVAVGAKDFEDALATLRRLKGNKPAVLASFEKARRGATSAGHNEGASQ